MPSRILSYFSGDTLSDNSVPYHRHSHSQHAPDVPIDLSENAHESDVLSSVSSPGLRPRAHHHLDKDVLSLRLPSVSSPSASDLNPEPVKLSHTGLIWARLSRFFIL